MTLQLLLPALEMAEAVAPASEDNTLKEINTATKGFSGMTTLLFGVDIDEFMAMRHDEGC